MQYGIKTKHYNTTYSHDLLEQYTRLINNVLCVRVCNLGISREILCPTSSYKHVCVHISGLMIALGSHRYGIAQVQWQLHEVAV